jgi:hypothetical protein
VQRLKQLDEDRVLLEANARAYQQHIVRAYTVEAYTRRMDEFLHRLALAPQTDSNQKQEPRPSRRSAA